MGRGTASKILDQTSGGVEHGSNPHQSTYGKVLLANIPIHIKDTHNIKIKGSAFRICKPQEQRAIYKCLERKKSKLS